MRKIIYFLLIVPILAVLAHDVYLFTQNQDKGFMLTDAGWIWHEYHPESNAQWKIKLKEYEDKVKDAIPLEEIAAMIPVKPMEQEAKTEPAPVADAEGEAETGEAEGEEGEDGEESAEEGTPYTEEFTQKDGKDGSEVIQPKAHAQKIADEKAVLQDHVGFLLEQKAVLVLFGLLIIVFLIDLILFQMIFGLLFSRKSKSKDTKHYGKRKGY